MALFQRNRPDGTRVTEMPGLRHFMPFLIPRRNDAVVFFEQVIDVSDTLDYIARWNAGEGRRRLSLLQVLLASLVRILHERPRLNRFIAGRRMWQRNTVELSMIVIKAHNDDDARMTPVKQRFDAGQSLEQVCALIDEAIGNGRAAQRTASEKEVRLLNHLPRWAIPLVVRAQQVLDHFNLLPAALIRNDPLYCSAMVTNLGSIGVDAAYHHLFNHGTMTIFVAMGRVKPAPVVTDAGTIEVRPTMTLRVALDERVVDGHYAARSLQPFQSYIERPWLLEGDEGPGAPEKA